MRGKATTELFSKNLKMIAHFISSLIRFQMDSLKYIFLSLFSFLKRFCSVLNLSKAYVDLILAPKGIKFLELNSVPFLILKMLLNYLKKNLLRQLNLPTILTGLNFYRVAANKDANCFFYFLISSVLSFC